MAYERSVTRDDKLFAGVARTIEFEVFATLAVVDGGTSAATLMRDASGLAFKWAMAKTVRSASPDISLGAMVVEKTSAALGGITVTGTFNASRGTNTQRVVVTLEKADTEALAGGAYAHALEITTAGLEDVLTHGTVQLLVSAVSE
jgi:hypothetical protein